MSEKTSIVGETLPPRIIRMLIPPPANFQQSFAYFSLILSELCSQKSRFYLIQRNFPLYTQGVVGCLLGFWPSRPKPYGCKKGGNRPTYRVLFHQAREDVPPTARKRQVTVCESLPFLFWKKKGVHSPVQSLNLFFRFSFSKNENSNNLDSLDPKLDWIKGTLLQSSFLRYLS